MPRYEALSFDCYGTLIDWEGGMRDALAGLLRSKNLTLDVEKLLRRYGEIERETQQGPYRKYKEVLAIGVERTFREEGITLSPSESNIFVDTLPSWPKFPDTTEVLSQLKDRGYKLIILSNIDDDLIQASVRVIGVEFDGIITAEQVGSYKPSHNHWNRMLESFRLAKEQVLHVAQSYVHDVTPAKEMSFNMAWINRKGQMPGGSVRPDHELPDLRGLLDML